MRGLELSPTGSVAQEKSCQRCYLCGELGFVCGRTLRGKRAMGEGTRTIFFKPGLTVTWSKSGQEKKCHSFEVD